MSANTQTSQHEAIRPGHGKTIGMDMVHPFGVYLDGELIAEHESEREAQTTFDSIMGRTKARAVFIGQSS